VLVAGVTVAFQNATTAKCKLMLTRKGRTLLNSTGIVKLTAKGSFTPVGQATTSATKTLTLKARA
jgi:hypothetical protein